MCGIVGYIGQGKVQETLLNGLEKLEYRGYDSAGIFAVNQDNEIFLTKVEGRIEDLKNEITINESVSIGIGHTRWATHGPATQANAHPHMSESGRLALVHNGVIENYKELKETYLSDVTFKSQTDTEVIVALIEKTMIEHNADVLTAFKHVLALIKGSYAFGLIDSENPETLYAAKYKSPLLIGKGEGFNVIASDAMATIQATKEYIEIQDGEVVILTNDSIEIQDVQGNAVEREAYTAEIDTDDIDKGTYPYYMLKEIDEQPAVIRKIIQAYQNEEGQFDIEPKLLGNIQASDRLYIVACGTSYNAGMVGSRFFEQIAGIPTEVHLASEFAYQMPLLSEKPFFIFITQSGETADSRQALVKVNEFNYPSLTITNVKGSTLSREATYTLLLHAGPEISVASTKAYTAQVAVMAILADVLAENSNIDMKQELGLVATSIETILTEKEKIKNWVEDNLIQSRNAFYIGRQLDYFVAMEAALKLKEISYIQTEAFAAGELKHGTIALIEEGTPVIGLITEPVIGAHTRGNIEEVRARGAQTMIISTEDASRDDDFFVLQTMNSLLTPLCSVVVTQLVAYYAALAKGYDVDKPRNLAKSVTVE